MGKAKRSQPTRTAAASTSAAAAASSFASTSAFTDWSSRRTARYLADLEKTNYTEPSSSRAPAFAGVEGGEEDEEGEGKRRGGVADLSKLGKLETDEGLSKAEKSSKKKKRSQQALRTLLLYRKSLATQLAELPPVVPGQPDWRTAEAKQSKKPPRIRLCSVCSQGARYSCRRCGLRVCDRGCGAVHDETRCERRERY